MKRATTDNLRISGVGQCDIVRKLTPKSLQNSENGNKRPVSKFNNSGPHGTRLGRVRSKANNNSSGSKCDQDRKPGHGDFKSPMDIRHD